MMSQPYIRYLGVMIDARLNFKQQVEHVSTKASAVRASLARLMPNVGGPKQTVVISGHISAHIRNIHLVRCARDPRKVEKSWTSLSTECFESSQRLPYNIRGSSVCHFWGSAPEMTHTAQMVKVLAKEKQTLYQRKRSSTLSTEELREEERQNSICRWQLQWDAGKKDAVRTWLLPSCYLHRFKRDDSPECSSCPGKPKDTEHVFFVCPRFNLQRDQLETILNQRIQTETLVEAMLSTKAAWNATSTFATEVLTDLRSIERKRARDSN
ncbi:hypothetical protein EVAR_11914_1 [Eumeta japonica]|uniref:Uncharacterized protein n=1 Tax=Eumeta variegata TaxID=151549 RepID=A0A4C1U7W6_EUMVA|nr:hypothetical protein EVAR_11914_1 [Eumeta japonica]